MTSEELKLQIDQELARRHFLDYMKLIHPDYDFSWWNQVLSDKLGQFLQDVKDKKSPRLMIFLPPRSGKSEQVSIAFPSWAMGKDPKTNFIVACYGQDLANDFSRKCRDLVNDDLYPFPVNIQKGNESKTQWSVEGGGTYRPAGAGSAITGKGADIFIIDDPVKNADDATSERYQEKMWDWYTSTALSRLSPGGGMIVTLTRWHENDLAGQLLQAQKPDEQGVVKGDKFDILKFPAIATEDEEFRKKGEPLQPERFTLEMLERVRLASGSRVWNALYQQNPTPDDGTVFMRKWFNNRFSKIDVPNNLPRNFYSDTAYGKERSDYSATIVYSIYNNNLYVWGLIRKNLPFTKYISWHQKVLKSWGYSGASKDKFEPKATGVSIVQTLKEFGINAIEGVSPKDSKLTRAESITPIMEAGRIYFHEDFDFGDLIEEAVAFPNGKYDDQVDCLVGAVSEISEPESWMETWSKR